MLRMPMIKVPFDGQVKVEMAGGWMMSCWGSWGSCPRQTPKVRVSLAPAGSPAPLATVNGSSRWQTPDKLPKTMKASRDMPDHRFIFHISVVFKRPGIPNLAFPCHCFISASPVSTIGLAKRGRAANRAGAPPLMPPLSTNAAVVGRLLEAAPELSLEKEQAVQETSSFQQFKCPWRSIVGRR